MDKYLENCTGIQFNGWNFAHICDWILNQNGTYPAEYFEEISINSHKIKRNDWILKNKDGSFIIITDLEHQNLIEKSL